MSKDLRIVTVASDLNHPGFTGLLRPSCEHYGLKLDVLECGPASPVKRWNSFRDKDRLLHHYLKRLPGDQLVLFSDGYDAFFLAGEDEILRRYEAFARPLVFSAETNCAPRIPGVADRYPPAPTPARFLNSGGFIGLAGHLRACLRRMDWMLIRPSRNWSNQYRWARLFLKWPGEIHLDSLRTLFYTASTAWADRGYERWARRRDAHADPIYWREELDRLRRDVEIMPGRIRYRLNGNTPCHVHLNGPIYNLLDRFPEVFAPLLPWKTSAR